MIKILNKYSYREADLVGQGAYSSVYKGLIEGTQQIVAIKVIDWERVNDKYFSEGFQREVRIMQDLNHPNIVKIHELINDDTQNKEYLIMEFCDSQSLNDFVNENGGLLNENITKIVLQQLLTAFREMINKEYLHRDLKLENILIHQKTLKLADFGFASKADYSGNKLLKECVGTPLYMAPQLLENKYYSVKSDIWSIGVLAYRMITGQFPWDGSTTKELLRAIKTQQLSFPTHINISDDLKDFIINCLQYSERDRLDWEDLYEHKIFKNKYIIQKQQVKRDHLQIALNQVRQMFKERKTPVEQLFSNLDLDGDHKLTFEEFQSLLLFVNNFMDIHVQKAIFYQYNKSRNNLLNFDEFSKIFIGVS